MFKYGVTLEALVRRLRLTEIESMNFPGGFEPCQAYDGFLEKVDNNFECCICMVDKRVWWKNKKDICGPPFPEISCWVSRSMHHLVRHIDCLHVLVGVH